MPFRTMQTYKKPEAELKKEYKAMAERRVRLGIFLADLGGKENVEVTPEEISQAMFAESAQNILVKNKKYINNCKATRNISI